MISSDRPICFFLISIVLISLGCITLPEEKHGITSIRIGYQPTTHHLAEMTASEMGWWEEDLKPLGVINIQEIAFPCGVREMIALQNGELDVAFTGTASVIIPISLGLDAKIVGAANVNGSNLVLRPGNNYSGPWSLLGRRIGCFPAGSCQDTILRKWLSENDINLSKVSIVPMGPGEAFWAMSQGSLDGVFVPQPGSAMIELNGIGKSVKASGDIWPNHACCGIAVSGIMIREHPDLVMQIVKTSINATDYINTHPDEAARIYSNRTGQDLNMIISSIDTWDGRWIIDPHRLINDTLEFARLQYGLNYTQKMLTEKDLFDTRFYDKVTA